MKQLSLLLTFARVAVSALGRSPWQIVIKIKTLFAIQALRVVPAHAMAMDLFYFLKRLKRK